MSGFNKTILMGRLTRNPELRFTPSGTPVASFGLAVSRRFKQGDELKEEVCFVGIVVFGKQAEHVGQYLKKGSAVIVEGRLQQRRWETEDGQKRNKHEIVAQTVTFLPSTNRATTAEQTGGDGGYGEDGGDQGLHDPDHDGFEEDRTPEHEEVPVETH